MPASEKRDRTARLLKIALVLHQNPRGLTPQEIAHFCNVCVRTTYRDLRALQDEMDVPIWEDNRRYGLVPGYFLPPLKITLSEAMALFLSARLASRYADERDPFIESAFLKLASVLPAPISEHVHQTVRAIAERQDNATFVRVFEILTRAWATQRRVRIWYSAAGSDGSAPSPRERLLEPYFIEPSGIGHSCYVIGFDHLSSAIRTFKIERIREIELTGEEYAIPADWSAHEYLRASWGIVHDDEVGISLRFSKAVAARVKEAIWHHSQRLTDEPEGTVHCALRVAGTMEITPWILSWGEEVEVLAPPELRHKFAEIAKRQAAKYALSEDQRLPLST